VNFLYRVAEQAALYGAHLASLVYQKHFCDEGLPTIEQNWQLLQENVGPVIDPKYSWLFLEPGNDPRFFCSTTSRCPPDGRHTLRVPITKDEMYVFLTTDAARYRSEFMTSSVQMIFGGNVERQNQSRYPLVNMEREKQGGLQKQHTYYQPRFLHIKATAPGFNQPIVEGQWFRERQPSPMVGVQARAGGALR
jgi:hypothetical protein